jgi:hypothetical protein
MGRLIIGIGSALMLAAGPALAEAQPTKSVSGTITAISGSSITVKAGAQDMTFAIDGTTEVITPGGGTKSRAAKAEGKAGTTVTELLKAGQAVEVKYHESGMHAASIRTISAVPTPSKSQTAAGVVSAISGTSLTVKGTSEEWTFSVDEKTTVVGIGIGTASKKLTGEGKKPTLTTLLQEGDTVSVTYRDGDSGKHASVVRLTRKKG